MLNNYLVTIGVPIYRSVKYIERALLSVLCQTYPCIEILLVDDCSDDGTMEIVNRIVVEHPRGGDVKVLRNDRNYGVSFSRNRIIEEAKGDYLYFMDSDDYIELDTIDTLINEIKNNMVQVVYGSYDVINEDLYSMVFRKPYRRFFDNNSFGEYAFSNISKFQVMACNALIELNFLRCVGLKFMNISYWEDMVFSYELVTKVCRAVLVPYVTYHYCRHSGSLSNCQNEYCEKSRIKNNVKTIRYLKFKCQEIKSKDYYPFLVYNLNVYSFHIICYIIKNKSVIFPSYSWAEMKDVINSPIRINDIIHFKQKLLSNLLFLFVGKLPFFLSIPIVWTIGKMKRII